MHSELSVLSSFSAQLGRNPLLVQAASGNTSVKLGSELWVKVSGAWLADAERDEIFLPVDLAQARSRVERISRPGVCSPFLEPGAAGRATGAHIRPSVETPMHALMPHRVVVHVHAVNTICWALRQDGPMQLADRLNGLAWRWIPYVESGLPLAMEVRRVISSAPDVLVLANHGLVIGAGSFEEAGVLIANVEKRLALPPRTVREPCWAELEHMAARHPAWRVPAGKDVHALATDPACRAILAGGLLYPCHAIYLGPSASIAPAGSLQAAEERHQHLHGASPKIVVVEGSGILVSSRMTLAETEVLAGLAQVVRRLHADDPIRYLTDDDLAALSSSDPHQYSEEADDSVEERAS